LLVAGYWLLVAGCWLLVAGYWLLVAGCWLLVAGYGVRGTDNKQQTNIKKTPASGRSGH
jgi:hypothetical protein